MDLESPTNIVGVGANVGKLELSALLSGGRVRVRDGRGAVMAELVSGFGTAVLAMGGGESFGAVRLSNQSGEPVIVLDGRDGDITLRDRNGDQTVLIDGRRGDIRLTGGDAAEEFEVDDENVEPGSVMVIADEGRLAVSREPYDRRIAGVVSGAGDLKPGIVLDPGYGPMRRPVALAGRAYCRVDATAGPIAAGDLLTSSSKPGHAMKAQSPERAFGAVLGKALAPLTDGVGLIPALIALQ